MDQASLDQLWMRRAISLARLGAGTVSPNPQVGCVLVSKKGELLGEGYHQVFGGPHAEVIAVNDALSKGHNLAGATAYVTLEPCAHHGKTPPCADLLIAHQVSRVVVAHPDPNPLVNGGGMAKIQASEIAIDMGLLLEEAATTLRPFLVNISTQRPYIILKWAETLDGYMAPEAAQQAWISGPLSKTYVHQLRAQVDAVAVGRNTYLIDKPQLNLRHWVGKQPKQIVLSSQELALPEGWLSLSLWDKNYQLHLGALQHLLQSDKVGMLLIETGPTLAKLLFNQPWIDEIHVIKSKSTIWGKGRAAPLPTLPLAERLDLGQDEVSIYKRAI